MAKRKHLHDDHHFKAEEVENPTVPAEDTLPQDTIEDDSSEESAPPVIIEEVFEEVTSTVPMSAISTESPEEIDSPPVYTSPVEEKIHDLVEEAKLNGWNHIDSLEHHGLPVIVSEKPGGEGLAAIWRRTRVFAGKKWKDTGKWVNAMTGVDILFSVNYWRERY